MKKCLLVASFTIGILPFLSAQVNPHALGIRGGIGGFGYGGEISYQHGLGSSNRIEIDLGWRGRNNKNNRYTDVGITGIYQWVGTIEGGFNWYAGVGGQVGLYDNRNNDVSGISLGLGGQVGVEFDFKSLGAPIAISLDTRPMISLGNYYYNNRFGYGVAFGIRYTF